ncbi:MULTISPECIES: nicotinate phosphoribosyltransferase [Thermus]|jgi:nicotinate phosphoribosyltransferase|uniref:Nicotinate phosphoribosyltransferase n=1 Tax=Thermus brockianus TaxID=56956 RepID=A0A1J0LXA4_THEBO|nr:nicotinate phosphoribosyltransferase [Thermus brockianus]APD10235.1 nicotinate phosphoribosyltransferase [Thermus brockianus]BDG16485.1 nicotinate phosphoribosyltransferase [Thermus brockianus]
MDPFGILYTDLYQLTMGQVYFRLGLHEREALFEAFYRKNPDYGAHQAGYTVFAGLDPLLSWMETARFGNEELEALGALKGRSGKPLFAEDYLRYLKDVGGFSGLTVRALPEGRVAHPQVPLLSVEGPLLQAQLLETALLNRINYETLIATKASRVREAAGEEAVVLEFGLRRAPGKGGESATRASLIGGANRSSAVSLSHLLGLPSSGTHAHSLVQAFLALGYTEEDAFQAFAEVFPDDTILLLDTVDTLHSGLPHALKVFERLRRKGHRPVGVRIDSGDLAYLAIQVAKELDKAGFADTLIVLSGDLDELVIWQIKSQILEEAPRYGVEPEKLLKRLVYGVGTRMVVSWGYPALGGVYKLVAIRENGTWAPAIKISDSLEKVLNPGHKKVYRVYDGRGLATADLLATFDEEVREDTPLHLRHPTDPTKRRTLRPGEFTLEPLLEEAFRGRRLFPPVPLEALRERRQRDVARLDPGVRRLVNPHIYHVSLTERLFALKEALVAQLSG